ncbi:hypothetical protein GCM10011507_32950 [Edaphobacter acidisoli]|uniref:B box-type domain-containing protein n=1 Tax=Edaphobacter acidisoli TaxID=2040573 RepID=A0A916S0F0_9BACT|nr:B-box zinc finger protein [Edaphobacter acidisoli]GGA79133.1 hypothetical protein GCM10011507_32950 [Edaphobacter acidisoli]
MTCANHPDRENVAFCQHCGKAICQECVRNVGSSVYCEACLAEKLSGTAPAGGYAAPAAGAPQGGAVPPPFGNDPNPALAGLLGIIPGVGAMYNGQFAKGIVHLVIFAILVSLAHDNGFFGLMIAGWVIYQIFEAYHTARARRDGTPLPNPFGLNDLGEKLGFGKAWPTGAPSQPNPSAPNAASSAYAPPPPAAGYSPYTAPPAANWSVPQNPAQNPAWNWENYVPPQQQPYVAPPFSPVDPNAAYTRNRFPSGAIWLIALGLIFLVGNSHWMFGLSMHWFVPFLLIGFGVWLFVRKMTEFGAPLADDGTALYRYRFFHAIKGSIWIVLIGVLFLLDSFNILSWGRSWPLFIIVAGLMAVFRGVAYSGGAPYAAYPPPQGPPPDPSAPSWTEAPPASTHSVVPPVSPDTHDVSPDTHDREGN